MTTTTNVEKVKLNIMTSAQYSAATKDQTALYAVTDADVGGNFKGTYDSSATYNEGDYVHYTVDPYYGYYLCISSSPITGKEPEGAYDQNYHVWQRFDKVQARTVSNNADYYLGLFKTPSNGFPSTDFLSVSANAPKVNASTGDIVGYQKTSNLVTSVSSASTDTQYPSAKLFYDTCGDIETLINAL